MRKKLQETERMKKKEEKNRQSRVMMLSGDEGERIKEKNVFESFFEQCSRPGCLNLSG